LELVHGRLSGQAYGVEGKLIIAPGTEFATKDNRDLRGSDKRRRRALLFREGLFEEVAEHSDRKRLLTDWIEFDRASIATRCITGARSPCAKWEPVETGKNPTAADGGPRDL